MLEEVQTPHGKWWVPFVWVFNLIKDSRHEGRITDDYMMKALMEVSLKFLRSSPEGVTGSSALHQRELLVPQLFTRGSHWFLCSSPEGVTGSSTLHQRDLLVPLLFTRGSYWFLCSSPEGVTGSSTLHQRELLVPLLFWFYPEVTVRWRSGVSCQCDANSEKFPPPPTSSKLPNSKRPILRPCPSIDIALHPVDLPLGKVKLLCHP